MLNLHISFCKSVTFRFVGFKSRWFKNDVSTRWALKILREGNRQYVSLGIKKARAILPSK